MELSIVTSLYYSERHIVEFHRRASAAARALVGEDFQIIAVNDGSPDRSLEVARALAEQDPHFMLVDLSRNFGHHKALMTGLSFAKGELVFLLDSDLEEAPEWLQLFAERLTAEHECDVIYGVQKARKGGLFERVSGNLFYALFRAMTGIALPENVTTARLMTRRFVDALLKHDEREMFLVGISYLAGFEQRPMEVEKLSTSETIYTLRRKLAMLVNYVTSFSAAPLIFIFYSGLLISLIAGTAAAYLVARKLLFAAALSGWTSVIVSIWLLGGMMMSYIGVVGIYLAKVYSEVKRRPYTIVRQVYGARN